MGYFLLDRFQGTLVGSHSGHLGENPPWLDLAQAHSDSLIEFGKVDSRLHQNNSTCNPRHMSLALLPVILFFHDSPSLLKTNLLPLGAKQTREDLALVWLWSKAIAILLTNLAPPSQLISLLLSPTATSPLEDKLKKVQQLVDQSTPLTIVKSKLHQDKQSDLTSFALAFYYFLTSPRDFDLSVSRAAITEQQFPGVVSLTGALSGAYNGYLGINIHQRLKVSSNVHLYSSQRKAIHLFYAWSGDYGPNTEPNHPLITSSVQLLQPRSQLQLISQKESWLTYTPLGAPHEN